MFKRSLPIACALVLGASATTVQAATLPCVAAAEAETLVSALLPDAMRGAGVACASVLPSSALIRRPDGPLLQGYQMEADRAWPLATAAIARLIGPEGAPLAESTMMRPMLAAMIVPAIVAKMKPKDCRAAERIVSLMAPLPPRNTAALAVTILQIVQEDPKRATGPIRICPSAS